MGYLLINFCVEILLIKDGRSVEKVHTFSMSFPQFIGPTLPYQHLFFPPVLRSVVRALQEAGADFQARRPVTRGREGPPHRSS